MPTDMTGTKAAADFRMLTVMRAAMKVSQHPTASPVIRYSSGKPRRGLRRVLREFARPFEWVGKSCRRLFRMAYGSNPRVGIPPPPVPNNGDLTKLAASLEALRTQQALTYGYMRRQPLAITDGLLLMRMDDRCQLVPSSDVSLIIGLIDTGDYEPGVSAILRRFAENAGMIIDVGANVGLHTVALARLLRSKGKLLALEPTPLTFRALRATIAANGLLPCVEALQVAAGASCGECPLHLHPISGRNSLIAYPDVDEGSIAVTVATLDSLVPPRAGVDLVKIDAPGAEFGVLQGMMRILTENTDIIVVLEFCTAHLRRAGARLAEIIDFMAGHSFSAYLVEAATGRLSPLDPEQALAMPSAHVAFGKRDRLQPMTVD
jgi:FkbM family methyltransferase